MTIRTADEFYKAISDGASAVEVELAQPVSLSRVAKPLTISGVIDLSAGVAEWTSALSIVNCQGLTLDGLKLIGEPRATGGFVGRGVTVRGGTGLTIRRCAFSQLTQGIVFVGSEETAIIGCDFFEIQSDGVIGQEMRHILIAENWFRRWKPQPGDHADLVQFHSTGAAADVDGAILRDNLGDVFDEDMTQGFWLQNPNFGGHRNILVERNLMFNTLWNSIGVGGCKDPVVRNNRLFKLAGSKYTPRIDTRGVPLTLEGNEAPEYAFAKWGDPLPAGNMINKPIDKAAFDALRAEWLAKFRGAAAPVPTPVPAPAPAPAPSPAPPAPDLKALRDRVQKARLEIDAAQDANTRALYAIDKLLASLP